MASAYSESTASVIYLEMNYSKELLIFRANGNVILYAGDTK